MLADAGGPSNVYPVGPVVCTQSEEETGIALRQIAKTAAGLQRLFAVSRLHGNPTAQAVPVAASADQAQGQPVVCRRRIVAQQHGGLVAVDYEEVAVAVVVVIRGGRAAPHHSSLKKRTGLRGDFGEAPLAVVEEKLVALALRNLGVESGDVVVDVAVGHVEVRVAVAVEIAEVDPKSQAIEAGCPQSRSRGPIAQ